MRIFEPVVFAALLLVGGCHSASTASAMAPRQPVAQADLIACAEDGGKLARTCSVELGTGADGQIVTVRNADGGFHRLLVTRDGRGVIAADGAQPARVTTVNANTIEVAIGADRYRLPATVKGR